MLFLHFCTAIQNYKYKPIFFHSLNFFRRGGFLSVKILDKILDPCIINSTLNIFSSHQGNWLDVQGVCNGWFKIGPSYGAKRCRRIKKHDIQNGEVRICFLNGKFLILQRLFCVIPVKTGIQAPSLRKQGTIKNWIPVFTGNPGYPLSRV